MLSIETGAVLDECSVGWAFQPSALIPETGAELDERRARAAPRPYGLACLIFAYDLAVWP